MRKDDNDQYFWLDVAIVVFVVLPFMAMIVALLRSRALSRWIEF